MRDVYTPDLVNESDGWCNGFMLSYTRGKAERWKQTLMMLEDLLAISDADPPQKIRAEDWRAFNIFKQPNEVEK